MTQVQTHTSTIYNERLRLAALAREDITKIGLLSVIFGMAFMLFHFQGNTTDITLYGRSALLWMKARWSSSDAYGGGNYTHGYLIPWVSLGLLYLKRDELMDAPKYISRIGLGIVVLALFTHYIGSKVQHPRLSLAGLILLFWGVPFYFYGWYVARVLVFPCAFLIFCIPLNFLDSLTFPLRMWVTSISTVLLNALGIVAEQSGTAIYSRAAGGFSFDVADPCSGLRSLLAMTALTAVYAYLTQKTLVKKWLLFLSAIPLAVIGNVARITTIGLVAEAFGDKLATGIYHDYSNYVVFSVAIGLMVALGSLLNLDWKEVFQKWKRSLFVPS